MTPPPAGTDGLTWLIGIIAVAIIAGLAAATPSILAHFREQRETLQEVKAQVSNDHGTNLREDLDQTREDVQLLQSGQSRNLRFLEDLDTSLRSLVHSMDRHNKLSTRDMLALREDVSEIRHTVDTAAELASTTAHQMAQMADTVGLVVRAVENHFMATPEVQEVTIRRGIQIAKEELHLGDLDTAKPDK